MSDARRPAGHENEPAPPEQELSQEELERTSRDAGGDAEAAGTTEEREKLALDEDDTFGGEDT
ncbi:hypothetical protein [Egicoccus sp. AB-alg6-2]|uniref:hypothetical protein n=1 Tax=Egicoccus sp. AB-alg6-2 TaxID=3242692 RepID=UPI00359E8568